MVTRHRSQAVPLLGGLLSAFSAAIASGLIACSAESPAPTATGGQSAATAGSPAAGGAPSTAGGAGGTMATVAGSGSSAMAGSGNAGSGSSAMAGSPGAAGQAAVGGSPSAGSGAGGSSAGGSSAGGSSAAGSAGKAGASTGGSSGGVDLFNGTDLTGFNVYRETTEKKPGTLLTGAQATAIFKPENGMIHVYADIPDGSAQPHYTLVTTKSYSKYILTWEYKWGTKKFAPYTDVVRYPRDAGVLWHLHGDVTQLWPASMEFQNKDGSTGDIFALYAHCTSTATASNRTTFAEGGMSVTVNGDTGFTQHSRSANFEVANDWTPLVMQVNGDSAVYTVNGHIVNRLSNVQSASGTPVTSGPIAWQAEQAEVYYRNLRIQVLP